MKFLHYISIVISIVIGLCPGKIMGQAPVDSTHASDSRDSADVVRALNRFVDAFSNLNWEEFSECFVDEATAFFPPSAGFAYRANNKQEILALFKKVFDNARRQKSSPPYIIIQPLELRIQMTGTVAIATFMLKDPTLFGRRTIVLRKVGDRWLIVHLHASGVELPPG